MENELDQTLTQTLSHVLWIGGATDAGKPSLGPKVSDPERAKTNLYARDMLLANYLKEQVSKYGYIVYEVDSSFSADELADMIEQRLRSLTL